MIDRRAATLPFALPRRAVTPTVAPTSPERSLAADAVRLLGIVVWLLAFLAYAITI